MCLLNIADTFEPNIEIAEEPPLPDPDAIRTESAKSDRHSKRRTSLLTPGQLKVQKKFGKPVRDTSYADELRREQEAERRRQKQMEMLEKMKNRKQTADGHEDDDEHGHNFEDCKFEYYCKNFLILVLL